MLLGMIVRGGKKELKQQRKNHKKVLVENKKARTEARKAQGMGLGTRAGHRYTAGAYKFHHKPFATKLGILVGGFFAFDEAITRGFGAYDNHQYNKEMKKYYDEVKSRGAKRTARRKASNQNKASAAAGMGAQALIQSKRKRGRQNSMPGLAVAHYNRKGRSRRG